MYYQYLPEQTTNQALAFADYIEEGERRSISTGTAAAQTEKQQPAASDNPVISTQSASGASKSAKTFKDLGNLVAGTYTGTGKLTLKGKVIEEYKDIRVVLSKIDKTNVSAEVIENNGESFFSSEDRYGIEKSGGKYTLTLQGIPAATMTVGKDGRLSYLHPKVNIDGDIYTLEISAMKK